jgi:hypothetical protein
LGDFGKFGQFSMLLDSASSRAASFVYTTQCSCDRRRLGGCFLEVLRGQLCGPYSGPLRSAVSLVPG